MMRVDLETAKAILEACVAKAKEEGVAVGIAVLDETGHLVALNRMDGAIYVGPESAHGKAYAAWSFRRESADLQRIAEKTPHLFATLTNYIRFPFFPMRGGLLLRFEVRIVGAVGVGGSGPERDERIAQAGVAAFDGMSSEG